jgi:tetratricopeptide (TPR) repeat protein/TolB-like protein
MTVAGTPSSDPLEALRAALGTQYLVERLLGQGGMGTVYLARDITLDRPVAIKVINPDVAANSTLRERFLQEARTVARLRHPNIVPVYAAGETGGMLYFVMEFVPGESLRDVLTRDKALPADRAERILREVALALGHAHALGLVHRDVKPENILIDQESGAARLTDFGVARALEHAGELTQAGMILGSPKYMSPEQASGDSTIDGRSDLYSLALVGYELFTGEPVIQSNTVAGMLVKHLTETPPPLATKTAMVAPHVAAAIDRGLAKNPAERWQTGREFAEAVAGGQLTASGEVRGLSTRRGGRTQRIRAALAAAGIVVALFFGWLILGRGATPGNALLVVPFEIQSGDQSVAWLHEGSVNMLTLTFGQWTDLNVVDYERTLSLLDAEDLGEKARLSLDDALLLARRADAGRVVTGQVQSTRDSLIVIAKLYDVGSGKSTTQAQEGASLSADPRPLFDRLAQQLLSIADGRTSSMQLAQATTTSLSAYRAFLDGVKHLNGWRLIEAEGEFARAVALDSTFALAYHKRSLGLGWSQAGGPDYITSAERAFALSQRLPPRERSLVEGHYHLTKALAANNNVPRDTARARVEYAASIRSYSDLITRGDSLTAEAWYGLADAYFHSRFGVAGLSNDTIRTYTTLSLRGFHRTLAIDSTYHLAYSHLVQLYNASASGSNLLISGDSALLISGPSDVARLGGPAGVQRMRDQSAITGVEISKAWLRADSESSQPVIQLAQSFAAAGHDDSGAAVLQNAMARPSTASPMVRMTLLQSQVGRGDTAAAATLRYVLDHYTGDSLRSIPVGQRIGLDGYLMTAAGLLGRSGDVDRAAGLYLKTDSLFPFSTRPTAQAIDLFVSSMHLAMGDSMTPAVRRMLLATTREMDADSSGFGNQVRNGSQSIPYLAFLLTRDTTFLGFVKKWTNAREFGELDALAALSRGDTATARRLAEAFPSPDSLRNPRTRFGYGGMRSVARAEVLTAIGQPRRAAETFDATSVERINQNGLAEPGYPIWVRTWMARARLWAQLDERDKAIAAYEEFIRRWKDADGSAAEEVAQARKELAQLRDPPKGE